MEKPTIVAYLKPSCGWSRGVRAVFAKYELPYEDKDIINIPENRVEMEQLSGQPLSPCVVINGVMLADVSGEEVEQYLVTERLVESNDVDPGVALNAPCSDAEHAAQAQAQTSGGGVLKFFGMK